MLFNFMWKEVKPSVLDCQYLDLLLWDRWRRQKLSVELFAWPWPKHSVLKQRHRRQFSFFSWNLNLLLVDRDGNLHSRKGGLKRTVQAKYRHNQRGGRSKFKRNHPLHSMSSELKELKGFWSTRHWVWEEYQMAERGFALKPVHSPRKIDLKEETEAQNILNCLLVSR